MLEESICGSPQKERKSVHERWLAQKNRSHKEYETTKIGNTSVTVAEKLCVNRKEMELKNDEPVSFVNSLYYDINSTKTNKNQKFNLMEFNIFEDLEVLAAADHLCTAPAQANSQKLILAAKQEFKDCNKLLQEAELTVDKEELIEDRSDISAAQVNISTTPTESLDKLINQELVITETELLICCEQVEEEVSKNNISQLLKKESIQTSDSTKTKSLVEMILDDFCSPPDRNSQCNAMQVDEEVSKTNISQLLKEESIQTPHSTKTKSVVEMILDDFCSPPVRNSQCNATQVEEEVSKTNISQLLKEESMQTPNSTKTKSVVEMILDDFCSPPNRNSQCNARIENIDKTPTFLHKHKPLSTYNRRRLNVNKRNISQNIENSAIIRRSISPYKVGEDLSKTCSGLPTLRENGLQYSESNSVDINNKYRSAILIRPISPHNTDEGVSNASSTLSVQEAPALQPVKANAINMNNSQRLCENLQNLSTYFTPDSDAPSEVNSIIPTTQAENYLTPLASADHVDFIRINRLVDEILALQRSFSFSRQSVGTLDFNGFQERDDEISEELKIENYYGIAVSSENLNYLDTVNQNLDTVDNLFEDCEYEWNDDCDFFINYKTQLPSNRNTIAEKEVISVENNLKSINLQTNTQEYKENSANALENIQFSEWIFDDLPLSETNQRKQCDTNMLAMSEAKCQGFSTASNKNIKISKEAQLTAQKILMDLPELPLKAINKNLSKEVSSAVNAKTSTTTRDMQTEFSNATTTKTVPESFVATGFPKLLTNSTEYVNTNIGFQTASKKNIVISKEAQETASNILAELPEIPFFHNETLKQQSNCEGTGSIASQSKPNDIIYDENINYIEMCSKANFVGFQTASKKNIVVSKEAQKRASKILNELPDLPYGEKKHKASMNNICEINTALRHESNDSMMPSTTTNTNMSLKANIGFQTASRKTITISEEAQARANKILSELPNIPYKTESNSEQVRSANKIQYKIKDYVDVEQNLNNKINEKVSITGVLDYQKNAETNKIEIKQNLDAVEKNHRVTLDKTHSITAQMFKIDSEMNNSKKSVILDEVESAIEAIIQRKRKLEAEKSVERTPPQLVRKKTKTPNTRSSKKKPKSNLSDLAVRSPLDSSQLSSIITRKNLLSLSRKRKRNNTPIVGDIEKDDVFETPNKKQNIINKGLNTPATPNLQDFFNSISDNASTPVNRTKISATSTASKNIDNHKDIDLTADMQRIHWDTCNDDSLNKSKSFVKTTKLLNTSLSNVSAMEGNPTPQQRIERLNMYGKATPVSPIEIKPDKNCKPSGLRRNPKRKTQFTL